MLVSLDGSAGWAGHQLRMALPPRDGHLRRKHQGCAGAAGVAGYTASKLPTIVVKLSQFPEILPFSRKKCSK
jgi:hypothetical protein